MYLIQGGVPGPGVYLVKGVYLVIGGVPGPGGVCTWSRGGGVPGLGGVPAQVLPP